MFISKKLQRCKVKIFNSARIFGQKTVDNDKLKNKQIK